MKMKQAIIAAALAVTTLAPSLPAHAYESKHRCDVVLYNGLTQAGTKRLVLCISPGGVSYNFGPENGKPELDIVVPVSKVTHYNNRYPSLALRNGQYQYEVAEEGIYVSGPKGHLATIKMRESEVNELYTPLTQYGISNAD